MYMHALLKSEQSNPLASEDVAISANHLNLCALLRGIQDTDF